MKSVLKIIFALIVILCPLRHAGAQELDSLRQKALSDKLEEYFLAIEREGTDVQKQECDFLIETAADSLIRQFIALKVYDHYLNSPLMGSEAVAIHVLDNWFFPGKVKMKNDIDMINARVYADFNRHSLVGMKAPELLMKDMEGSPVGVFSPEAEGDNGRFSIMYFYDTDCSKCRIETILLRNLLEDKDYPVDLFAVYAGDDFDAWKKYAEKQFSLDAGNVKVVNLWDPELDSDFQRKYGVLQTPRMFLVRPDGTIMGRGLDTEALMFMLRGIFTEVQLNYGGEDSARLFDGILTADGQAPSYSKVREVADYIAETTLPKGDTVMFRQLSGDFLYYLSTRTGEGVKEGLKYLIDNNINSCPKVWDTQDDSLKVIGFAAIMDDLLSKSAPGSEMISVKVHGEQVRGSKSRTGIYDLSKLRGRRNITVFYTDGCEICSAEKMALRELASEDRKINLLFINVDEVLSADPSLAEVLFDSFDLSSLPFIIETNRKGEISRRYLSFR